MTKQREVNYICTCGLLKVKKVGTHVSEGVERCNMCNRPLAFPNVTDGECLPTSLSKEMVTSLSELPGHRTVRSFGVVTELSATSGLTAASKGNDALDAAMVKLRRSAARLRANAVVGLRASPFGAAGGLTSAFGGDAVGVLLMGDAVEVVRMEATQRASKSGFVAEGANDGPLD